MSIGNSNITVEVNTPFNSYTFHNFARYYNIQPGTTGSNKEDTLRGYSSNKGPGE